MPVNKVLEILNDNAIIVTINDKIIDRVSHDVSTDTFFFWHGDSAAIQITTDNIGFSDWDEADKTGGFYNPFLIMLDVHGEHHIVKFFRNDTLEVIHRVKNILPCD